MGLVISSNKNQHFGCTFSGSLDVIAAIYHFPIVLMIKWFRNFKGWNGTSLIFKRIYVCCSWGKKIHLYPFVTLSSPHPHPNLFYNNNARETQVFCWIPIPGNFCCWLLDLRTVLCTWRGYMFTWGILTFTTNAHQSHLKRVLEILVSLEVSLLVSWFPKLEVRYFWPHLRTRCKLLS
jgi:hypothetical protein